MRKSERVLQVGTKENRSIMRMLSFVIPCYRSEKTITQVVEEIIRVVSERKEYDYEIIAVNDCSPDNVYEVLKQLADKNEKIKVVNLARNMGKHSAVMAGYSIVQGDIVVNLDDDGQCPTYDLWKLITPLEKDECDVTTAVYKKKKETLFKRIGSNVNLWMTELLLDKPKGLRMENFSAMKRFVCNEIVRYKNSYPYLEGLIFRVTKSVIIIPMEQRNRVDDNVSGFTLKKSIALLLNGLTAFSVKPLRVASICGSIFAMIGFLYSIFIIIRKIIRPEILVGYSSLMAVLLFTTGLIMMMLGLIGEYLGRIYICINDSPQYVIRNTINVNLDLSERVEK